MTIIIIRKKKEIKKNFPYEESFEIMEGKGRWENGKSGVRLTDEYESQL